MAKALLQREQVLDAVAAHLLAHGLGSSSLRTLAAAAGTSDRMLLYYFRDKADLMSAALERLAAGMAGVLDGRMRRDQRRSPQAFLSEAAELVLHEDMTPYMRLWTEIAGEAARGRAPFAAIATGIVDGFLKWIEGHLDTPGEALRRQQAAMILVMIDGLALIAPCAGGTVTQLALKEMTRSAFTLRDD